MTTQACASRTLAGVRVEIDPSIDGPADVSAAAVALGRLVAAVLVEQAAEASSTAVA